MLTEGCRAKYVRKARLKIHIDVTYLSLSLLSAVLFAKKPWRSLKWWPSTVAFSGDVKISKSDALQNFSLSRFMPVKFDLKSAIAKFDFFSFDPFSLVLVVLLWLSTTLEDVDLRNWIHKLNFSEKSSIFGFNPGSNYWSNYWSKKQTVNVKLGANNR